jgi:hypothetical protein
MKRIQVAPKDPLSAARRQRGHRRRCVGIPAASFDPRIPPFADFCEMGDVVAKIEALDIAWQPSAHSGSGACGHLHSGGTMTTARRITLTAGAVIVAFLIGFIWQYLRAERLSRTLDDTRRTLALTQTEATLGMAVIEAEHGRYEQSRQLASTFFSSLQRTAGQRPPAAQPAVTQILGQRDSVITLLSRSEPQSSIMLGRMLAQYRTALHAPVPAPAPAPSESDSTRARP